MTRVVLVDDDADFRATLKDLLAIVPDLEVVGEGDSGEQALKLVRDTKADVVVIDLKMPVTGRAAIAAIRRSRPLTRIIALSGSGEKAGHDAVVFGADAFVRKAGGAQMLDELVAAISRLSRSAPRRL